jgi:hypothetical protein
VAGFSFLERLAFELLEEGVCAGRLLPWVIMTSPATGEAIRAWLERSALRQYPKDSIILIEQSANPRLDMDGDLVAGADGRLLWTGNGHGGIFSALLRTDAGGSRPVERLRSLGVRHLVMHNVDNLCARPLWPARLGCHLLGGYDMTLSAVARIRPEEKLGIFARRRQDRTIEVLEYSECPAAVAGAAGPDGSLAFRWGHINTNIVRLERVRADVPPTLYRNRRVDAGGRVIETSTFEMLNQSLAGLLHPERVGIAGVGREFFQPVKSRGGEDSLEEAQSRLSLAHARRLAENGAEIESGALVELDPALGLEDDGARRDSSLSKAGRGWKIQKDSRIYLGVRHSVERRMPYGSGLSVGRGATFWVEATSPYGSIRLGADNGLIEDPAGAGKIVLGQDVRVEAGASIRIRIQGDGLVVIPDGATLSGCIDEVVPPGSVVALTGG